MTIFEDVSTKTNLITANIIKSGLTLNFATIFYEIKCPREKLHFLMIFNRFFYKIKPKTKKT